MQLFGIWKELPLQEMARSLLLFDRILKAQMNDDIAQQLLATVMGWHDPEQPEKIQKYFPDLQLLAAYKYDSYQQFSHGRHFIESLALWLEQFDPNDRQVALDFVRKKLIFVSDAEFFHLVNISYPDSLLSGQNPNKINWLASGDGCVLQSSVCKAHEIRVFSKTETDKICRQV